MLRLIVLLAVAVALVGCGKKYPMPSGGMPSASLGITRDRAAGWLESEILYVWIFENPECAETERSGLAFQLIWENTSKDIRVPVGQRLYVVSNLWSEESASVTHNRRGMCANQVSFVPEAGRRYNLHFKGWMETCEVRLAHADGSAVPTTEIERPARSCTSYVNALEDQAAREAR